VGKETLQNRLNEIKNKTDNAIMPEAEIMNFNKIEIIIFTIFEHPIKPVSFK
jgi:hypothetical protein